MGKTIAAYGGGFKPPTKGHLEVVKKALNAHPEIDEFIIYVGGKERDGIDQTESILIWDIFKKYLPMKVKIEPSTSPIGDIVRLGKNNPEDKIYFVIGGREGRQDDLDDIENRTKNIESSYPNMEVKVQVTPDEGMSGTNARKAAKISSNKLSSFLPDELSDEEKEEVFNIIRPSVKEIINENATYSNKIDYKKLIKDFTKHMIKIGKNIQPLPRVIFKHSDSDNASNFFGRTAYYDPNNQTIVLYTEGRHPKDIVRSFAHEMVHHTQYLEDRLGNVQTTNTNADANLDRIEREAYLDGNMVFRNWPDSIDGEIVTSINEKKKKTKDPFGLNAFAYELAMLREDNKDYYIYLDMDGVVANFDKRFEDLSGMTPSEFISKYDKNAFWDLIDEKHKIAFWRGIEVMPGADRLVNYVAQYPYEMLTAPSAKKQSVIGKSLWIKDKVGTLYSSQPKVTYKRAKEKHLVKPNLTKFDILIDDKPSTIDNWNNAGGTGIFYQSASQVINDLKKLGL